MRYLLDTHLLIWLAINPKRIAPSMMAKLEDRRHNLYFSAVSPWEIAVKRALNRPDFDVDADDLVEALATNGWTELPLTSRHGVVAGALPLLHRDPFDRAMIGQAMVEGLVFLTADKPLAAYGRPVELV